MRTLISITTLAVLCGLTVALNVSFADGTTNLTPQVQQMMQQFESTKEPDWLLKAIAATEHQKTSGVEEMIASRVALLKRVVRYYDPTYDTNPPPAVQLHVMPPMGCETGVSPEMITDPKLRDDYARRIAENRVNSQQHQTQTTIRRLMSKLVDLYLQAEHGNPKNVEMRLERQETPQAVKDAMQVLAREAENKQAERNGDSQSTLTNKLTERQEQKSKP